MDNLPEELQSMNINDDLLEAKFAFHVTRVKATETQPKFKRLKFGIADDPSYDGVLFGLPCVFFSTTLYYGDLPTQSPYPTDGKPGEKYWRVKVPLKYFDEYDIWRMRNPKHPQERLIFTRHDDQPLFEEGVDVDSLDKTNNQYLRKTDGKWYTNNWSRKHYSESYFVNFVVLNDFDLINCSKRCPEGCEEHCQWDTVKRGTQGGGSADRDDLSNLLKKQWKSYRTQSRLIVSGIKPLN